MLELQLFRRAHEMSESIIIISIHFFGSKNELITFLFFANIFFNLCPGYRTEEYLEVVGTTFEEYQKGQSFFYNHRHIYGADFVKKVLGKISRRGLFSSVNYPPCWSWRAYSLP